MGPIGGIRYTVNEVREHGKDRAWWRGRINSRLNSPVQKRLRPPSKAVDIPDSDWDVLILIDATRLDLFRDRTVELAADFDERSVRSKASATREWLDQNFTDEYGDTVYVTGNPQVSKYKPDRFHELVEVWLEEFDHENQTIPAEAVTDAAIQAHEEFPDKRMIVHYVQPHEPFVGHPELNFFSWDAVFPPGSEDFEDERVDVNVSGFQGTAFEAIYQNVATKSEVWNAYRENLDYVLSDVNRLLGHLRGRVVLTSDHGNAFPRFSWPIPVRVWSHPSGLRHRELITVPWLETTLSERPRIRDDGVNSPNERDEEALERTLSHLGYR